MKYEAKALNTINSVVTPLIDEDGCNETECTTPNWGFSDHIPASSPTGAPWRQVSGDSASTACGGLNTDGASKYDLISNAEWMTIVRNAESVESNFQSGVFARGWAANSTLGDSWTNTGPAPLAGPDCVYNSGADTCASSGDHLYRRTLTLSNGQEIWDVSGNVWELVDWDAATAGFQLGPTGCSYAWTEFPVAAANPCLSGLEDQLFPATPNGSSAEAFGLFYGGGGGAARRGGRWSSGRRAGAFTTYLGNGPQNTDIDFGFRCVYRPH
jgi:hypothetical protein